MIERRVIRAPRVQHCLIFYCRCKYRCCQAIAQRTLLPWWSICLLDRTGIAVLISIMCSGVWVLMGKLTVKQATFPIRFLALAIQNQTRPSLVFTKGTFGWNTSPRRKSWKIEFQFNLLKKVRIMWWLVLDPTALVYLIFMECMIRPLMSWIAIRSTTRSPNPIALKAPKRRVLLLDMYFSFIFHLPPLSPLPHT